MVVAGFWVLTGLLDGCQAPADAPPASPPPPPAVADLVVTAAPPDARSDIDKRVYTVSGDAQAQTSTTLDILGKIPSVTVTPSGKVQLLGSSGVTVLIDGKRPVNPDAALKALPAAQIDRIEVMTNPPAQYAAQGSGGIINLITRKRSSPGLTGTLQGSASTAGAGQFSLAPSLTRGAWTLEGSLGLTRDASESRDDTLRQVFTPSPGSISDRRETSDFSQSQTRASLRLAYRPSKDDTVSFSLEGSDGASARRDRGRTEGRAGAFDDYAELDRSDVSFRFGKVGLDYTRNGPRDGETLTASASVDVSDWRMDDLVAVDFDQAGLTDERFRNTTLWTTQSSSLSLDYNRPLGAAGKLALGGSWDGTLESFDQSLTILQGVGPGPAASRTVTGDRTIAAAYATLQFPLGPWTVKPGLRFEDDDFEVRTLGLSSRSGDTQLFPSLFLRRDLSSKWQLNLSYSARTNRPGVDAVNPFIVYSGETSARTGNPGLKPERTGSYEARLDYADQDFSLNLTVYDRETRDVWGSSTLLTAGGVSLRTTINAGRKTSRGAELSARGALGPQWKYVATANLFANRQDVPQGGVLKTLTDFTYTGNAQLEYRPTAPTGREADQLQLSLRYFGPQRDYQMEFSSFVRLDFTWRHPLGERLAAVFSVVDLLDSGKTRMRITSPGVTEETTRWGEGPTVKLAMVYRFGRKP